MPYKETIKRSTTQRGRHKRQTGGHGQFGDVVLEIRPLPRGSGFVFEDKISGGVVPRNFIPSVEKGIIEFLKEGPLGFPVVDLAVALIDGSYHSVNSSDAAFQTAARIGMSEGMPNCGRAAGADHAREDPRAVGLDRERQRRDLDAAGARFSASTRGRDGRAGTRSMPRSRNRSCTI